ncbi:cartilage-associated protein-like [Anticarsia gemmatalis]|uniref:cartilage-associated protein-like n=1 Tax=Anticarsia gemmatalis TaxID=129554 RepID=UPI003F75836F
MNYQLLFLVIAGMVWYCDCITPASLDQTYEKGLKAYTEERWSRCIEKFEESLHIYRLYRSVEFNCRLKCNAVKFERRVEENIDDLQIYEAYFNKRNCINSCRKTGYAGVNLKSNPEEFYINAMQAKKPYGYLHICYHQMNMNMKAASAAYTYLVAHPDDEIMLANVKFYTEQPQVDPNEIVDYEGDDYVLLYSLGKESYEKKNWAETVASMEEVIKDYISSENICRVECERQPGQEWSSEFVITLSNNMASLLHCRQHCQDKLKIMKYKSGVEFLADILNYLQISYYNLEKNDLAAEAVASGLVLLPEDEDMLANDKFYTELTKKKATASRSDVEYYFKRDKYEKDLLRFFHKENKDKVDPDSTKK